MQPFASVTVTEKLPGASVVIVGVVTPVLQA